MRLNRARELGSSILGIGHQFRYNSSDVTRVCWRLRFGNSSIKPERHQLDLDLAEQIETMWQEKRHAFE